MDGSNAMDYSKIERFNAPKNYAFRCKILGTKSALKKEEKRIRKKEKSLSRDPMASRDAYQKLCGLIADPGSSW